ncbi:hypothetical protein PAMP_003575 [Pampus punctatissimus]
MVPVTLTDSITKRKGNVGREGRSGWRMGRGLYVSPARALMGRGLAAGYHWESGWLLPAAWRLYTEGWRRHHHSAGSSLRYIPRRAVLYCPGNDERKLRKLASLDVDCAVFDCEDGVALSKKRGNAERNVAIQA